MPKTAIVVDSACTLPPQYLRDHHIYRVPVSLGIDGNAYIDPMDDQGTLRLLDSRILKHRRHVTTQGPSMGAFEQLIDSLERRGYSTCQVQTISSVFSNTYEEARRAVRARQVMGSRLTSSVVDTGTLFSGQSLLAALTARASEGGAEGESLNRQVEDAKAGMATYLVPSDPATTLARLQLRGERALSWIDAYLNIPLGRYPILRVSGEEITVMAHVRGFRAAVAFLVNRVLRNLEESRLKGSMLCLQQAGPLSQLLDLRSCQRLQAGVQAHQMTMLTGVASLATGVYSGAGSVVLSVQESMS